MIYTKLTIMSAISIHDIIHELINSNCIKIGSFRLKNGDISKYYFDMKNIISNPKLLKEIGDQLFQKLGDFDIICGIPYGGLPIASYISTTYNKPMIFVRDTPKKYGTTKMIEGEYKKEDRCVIIDDVITTGSSINEAYDNLKELVNVMQLAVIFDRQQNYKCHLPVTSLLYKNDVVKYMLYRIKEKKKSKLCFSADIEDPNILLEKLDKIGPYIVACKIHYDIINFKDLLLFFKDEIIKLSIKHDFLIIEDRKFNDISYIVEKQYRQFCNWIDMVTVHSLVTKDVISKLSGVLLVANMSNNTYDFTEDARLLANECSKNMIGFITQRKIDCAGLVCMTPGVSLSNDSIDDQKYKKASDIDTDFIIVGRALYNSDDIVSEVQKYL